MLGRNAIVAQLCIIGTITKREASVQSQWVNCNPFAFTRIWASPTFGPWITVSRDGPAALNLDWNEYSANPPFSLSGQIIVLTPNPTLVLGQVIVGPPSPYVELWIKPTIAGRYRAT